MIQGRSTTLILVFAAGLFLGMVSASRLAAQFRVGNNRQLSKTDLVGCAGKEVIVALNEFGPGTSGAHYHQGDSFTYVLEGSETYHVEGQPEIVVKTGDLLREPPMKVHTVANTDRVRLLVIRIQDKGVPDIVRVPGKR